MKKQLITWLFFTAIIAVVSCDSNKHTGNGGNSDSVTTIHTDNTMPVQDTSSRMTPSSTTPSGNTDTSSNMNGSRNGSRATPTGSGGNMDTTKTPR